jgi:hypothetical protein
LAVITQVVHRQQFSDDEEETDDVLAPLPDEPEQAEGDEDDPEDEVVKSESQIQSRDVSEPRQPPTETAPSSPKPHPLSVSLIPGEEQEEDMEQQALVVDDEVAVPELTLDPLGGPTDPTLDLGDIPDDALEGLVIPPLDGEPETTFEMADSMGIGDEEDIMTGLVEGDIPTFTEPTEES